MTIHRFRTPFLLATLAMAPFLAHAATPATSTDEEDTPAQKQLTEQYIKTAFDNMDTNKDGKIDQAEFHAFMEKYLARQKAAFDRDFAAADTNHDGKLSRAEVQKSNPLVATHFDDIDANGDGFLDKAEIRASIRARQLQVTLHGDADDNGDHPASSSSAG